MDTEEQAEFDRYAFLADFDITRSTCGGRAGRYASEVTQRAFAVWCDQRREVERLQRTLVEWQPVETAPEDEYVLLWGAKRTGMVVGMNHSRDGWVIDTPRGWVTMYQPTHWKPLPTPPSADAQAPGGQ